MSTAVLKSAVTWRGSSFSCPAQSQISREDFGETRAFHDRRSCTFSKNHSKASRLYIPWELCIATSGRKNMLIMSNDPPRAALCDYGKAIEAMTSKVTTIGPIYTLAPGVWTVARDGPYMAKIDTWAYGYAIAEVLGYKPPEYSKITQDQLASILRTLRASYIRGTDGEPLVDLVSKLLVWRPQDRWSAEQALEHKCWLPIALEQDRRYDDPAEAARGKRALLEDRL